MRFLVVVTGPSSVSLDNFALLFLYRHEGSAVIRRVCAITMDVSLSCRQILRVFCKYFDQIDWL